MGKVTRIEDIPGFRPYIPRKNNPLQLKHDKTMNAIQEYRDTVEYIRKNLYKKKDAD